MIALVSSLEKEERRLEIFKFKVGRKFKLQRKKSLEVESEMFLLKGHQKDLS